MYREENLMKSKTGFYNQCNRVFIVLMDSENYPELSETRFPCVVEAYKVNAPDKRFIVSASEIKRLGAIPKHDEYVFNKVYSVHHFDVVVNSLKS